jgi:hypothetical protein
LHNRAAGIWFLQVLPCLHLSHARNVLDGQATDLCFARSGLMLHDDCLFVRLGDFFAARRAGQPEAPAASPNQAAPSPANAGQRTATPAAAGDDG